MIHHIAEDTGHFTQIYQCENEHTFEERDIVSIKVHDTHKLRCPVCNTEKISCIGDNR